MNSRGSGDESNLVNLSGDLSALNQLDAKEALAFPFDHIYACHSEDAARRQAHLDKQDDTLRHPGDKDIATVTVPDEVKRLSERLNTAENHNKQLKNLLVYHLDLIQQQNELINKRDKLNAALKLENDALKTKVTRMDRRITVSQRHNINPAPVLNLPAPTVATTIKNEPPGAENQVALNSLSDFLMPDSRTNSYLFNNDNPKIKPLAPDAFRLNRPTETDIKTYLPGDKGVPSVLESSKLQRDNFATMIDNKPSYIKKEITPKTEARPEPLYTVTSNSGNTVIQKIQRNRRRTSGGIGSLSRLPKTPVAKVDPPDNVNIFEDDKSFERTFSVNKKSKMINTYGKSKTPTLPKKTPHYTGSLSDRLRLIDTTPTGEDPYQLGEADMREQSPIPKLMLQKSNHGRVKICSDLIGETKIPSRRIYDAPSTDTSTKMSHKIKSEKKYNSSNIISPYSVSHPVTRTSTDTCTHMSTYTHSRNSTSFSSKNTNNNTAKSTSTYTSKQTTTLTSAPTCKHSPVYTHTTRTTSTRTSTHTASPKATSKASQRSTTRKSSVAAPNKAINTTTQKALGNAPLTSSQTAPQSAPVKYIQPPHTVSLAHDSFYTTPPMTTHVPGRFDMAAITPTDVDSDVKKEPLSPPILSLAEQPGLDGMKKESDFDWSIYSPMAHPVGSETSLCDFSYGENSNLTSLPTLDVVDFRSLLESENAAADAAAAFENMDSQDYSEVEKIENESDSKKIEPISLVTPAVMEEESCDNRRGTGGKRGRKRTLSTAGISKNAKQNLSKPVGPKPKTSKGRAACRGKKTPLPGMTTRKPYHTLVGDPDLSWYLGLDPDVKMEDIDCSGEAKASTVEVPRWREKPYTSLYSLEGTENLDDKVFEKRHQKLEAEERRQLRWHMRRIREQRHVERLKMRQRDPWYSRHPPYQPSVYTIWPQPQRDVRMIEITDTIPVMAFGEDLPDIPPADFMLPWVRISKALKRSKRSKTLH